MCIFEATETLKAHVTLIYVKAVPSLVIFILTQK